MTQTQPGKRTTAADVARSLGLSRTTVGFVLNNTPGQTIPRQTRERVLAEATRLGYRPHAAAQALASGRSRIVLLVLPDWPLEYSMRRHLDEASLTLDRAGYSLVTMTPHPGGQARPLWQSLDPDVVMGLVPFAPDQLDRLRASGVPHVISAEPATDLAAEPLGHAVGPRLQVTHLHATGRRRLAFAGSSDPRIADLVAERRVMAAATYRELTDGELDAAVVDQASAAEVVGRWIEAGVDGIVAYNDEVAAVAAGTALRAGVRVPSDLAVIGHDNTPLAQLYTPSLSSIDVDTAGLGRYLAELALSAAEGTPAPTAGPETEARVVQRESTSPHSTGA